MRNPAESGEREHSVAHVSNTACTGGICAKPRLRFLLPSNAIEPT
jgi:hypothetical protein